MSRLKALLLGLALLALAFPHVSVPLTAAVITVVFGYAAAHTTTVATITALFLLRHATEGPAPRRPASA